MNKTVFYSELEDLLELPKGSLKGDQPLSQMAEWDSLAVISFIALADTNYGVVLPGKRVEACKTIDDLSGAIEEQEK